MVYTLRIRLGAEVGVFSRCDSLCLPSVFGDFGLTKNTIAISNSVLYY